MNQYSVEMQKVEANSSIITGNHNLVFGNGNKIIGDHNKIYGNSNMVFGSHNVLKGQGNKVIEGQDNQVSDPFADSSSSTPSSSESSSTSTEASAGESGFGPSTDFAAPPPQVQQQQQQQQPQQQQHFQPSYGAASPSVAHTNAINQNTSFAPSPSPLGASYSSNPGTSSAAYNNNPFSPSPTHSATNLIPYGSGGSNNIPSPFSPTSARMNSNQFSSAAARSRAVSAPPNVQNPFGAPPGGYVTPPTPPTTPVAHHTAPGYATPPPTHAQQFGFNPTSPQPAHFASNQPLHPQAQGMWSNAAPAPFSPAPSREQSYFQPVHQAVVSQSAMPIIAPQAMMPTQQAYVLVAQPIIVNAPSIPAPTRASTYEEPVKSAPQKDLINDGTMVFMINESDNDYIREFCGVISKMSGQKVGSHISAGRTCIVGLGDLEKIRFAIIQQLPELNKRLKDWSWEAHGKRMCADRMVFEKKMFKHYTRDDVDCWRGESNK